MKNKQYSFEEWVELEKFFEGKNTIMDTVKNFEKWNNIMNDCNGPGIYGGYGLSETFSGISIIIFDTIVLHQI